METGVGVTDGTHRIMVMVVGITTHGDIIISMAMEDLVMDIHFTVIIMVMDTDIHTMGMTIMDTGMDTLTTVTDIIIIGEAEAGIIQ